MLLLLAGLRSPGLLATVGANGTHLTPQLHLPYLDIFRRP